MTTKPDSAKSIFMAAVDKYSEDQWSVFLDGACGGDADLRGEVEKLLEAHVEMGSIQGPDIAPTIDLSVAEQTGTEIGPYKLLQELGEGGMGVVYMAEQSQPVKRRVALKIIKPGMDTGQVIARFEAERQALAMMDHPNIAKVFDAGATVSGRPFFVMELVNGIPVTRYSDEQHLTLRERLELFIPICHAVQHAHQKGIIHRDLKPSNVLVALYDDHAVPKVIDFGVAKATSQQNLTEKTLFTQLGQVVGTLEYMSPEQAQRNQLDIDTRSDVYSLGVLLYELLTGTTPFDKVCLRSAAFDELLRVIREEEPPRPSRRLSTIETLPSVAANRRIEPQRLSSLLRGELDWIVMKALEKDRARRYETANDFAADIRHHLDHEPVVACPPSAAYRFRKSARRNKVLLTSTALIALALIAGTAVATWQSLVATRAREQAVEQALVATRASTRAEQAEQEQRQLADDNRLLAEHERHAREEAEEKGRNLERQLRVAHATRLAAQSQALYEQSPTLSLLLAIEGVKTTWRHGESIVPVAHETLLNRLAMTGGRALPGHPNPTADQSTTVLSPRGKWLVARYGGFDGTIAVWDMTVRESAQTRRRVQHQQLSAIAASDRWLATGSRDATVRLWDLERPDPASSAQTFKGHDGWIRSIAFSLDGRWLATGSSDNTARLWDLGAPDPDATGRVLRGHEEQISSVAFSPNGRWLATRSRDTVRLWDLTADDLSAASVELGGDDDSYDLELIWAPSNRWLVALPSRGVPVLWDLESTDPRSRAIELGDGIEEERRVEVEGAMSPDSRWLVTTANDHTARLWDLSVEDVAGSPLVLAGHKAMITSLAFSPDNRWLATGSRDRTARLWDLTVKDPASSPVTLWGHRGFVSTATFSPDTRWLAVGYGGLYRGFVVRVWELSADGLSAPPRELRHVAPVFDLCWTPDSSQLVSGSGKDILIWNFTAQGPTSIPLVLYGHTDSVHSTVISPDGHWLVTGSGDKTFRIWDLDAARARDDLPVRVFESENKRVDGIRYRIWEPRPEDPASLSIVLRGHEFSGRAVFGGSWLVTADASSVRLWDWDVKQLLDRASRMASREMTDYERQYLPRNPALVGPVDGIAVMDPVGLVEEMTLSNVGLAQQEVPDTTDWKAFVQDDFERSEIGEQWEVVSGEWSIEDGRLRGTLTSAGENDRSEAIIKFVQGEMPTTVEVEFDTLGSADVSSQLRLMNEDSSKGYIAELCGFPHPGLVRIGRKGNGPLLWVVNPDNPPLNEFIRDAAQFDHKSNQRYRFRVLREPDRVTLFVDGKQVLSERVTQLDGSVLQLYPWGAPQDRVYFDNLRVRVPGD